MKIIKTTLIFFTFLFFSCSTVQVTSDYDSNVDFSKYKTFAFYKKGIDEAKISDLDKRRILKSIEEELLAKGLQKSENPDVLISIFTKSRQKVNISNNRYYYGYYNYYNPWLHTPNYSISKYTEGTLFVDVIDKDKKQLVWQGIGSGVLVVSSVEKKEKKIKEFVKEIIAKYPPKTE